ncbi:MAG TPA: nucleoside recognition domain-containing protein, partial [Candidatus Atribacteria bacterium]|nr:nucleoside recognition domain-containing protein [Candidatus Atribacteria bacterium]
MVAVLETVSVFAIPAFIAFILIYGHMKGVAVYETFVEGAKEGLTTAFRIIPYLVAMFVAIGMFRSSGAMEFVIKIVSPVLGLIGLPPEVLPLVIMRPMSGAASTGLLAELFKVYGPDSFIGRTASTVMGS